MECGRHDEGRLPAPEGGSRSERRPFTVSAPGRESTSTGIGVNLNQIARTLNSGASAPTGTLEAVERVEELAADLLGAEALG